MKPKAYLMGDGEESAKSLEWEESDLVKYSESEKKPLLTPKQILKRHRELEMEIIQSEGTSYHSAEDAWFKLKDELQVLTEGGTE